MKYLILLLLLTGCSTVVPVSVKFPEAPQILLEECQPLEQLGEEAKLSDVAKSVALNYSLYYECATKHEGFIEWYKKQKQIFE
jgi:hypothetical protein